VLAEFPLAPFYATCADSLTLTHDWTALQEVRLTNHISRSAIRVANDNWSCELISRLLAVISLNEDGS